MKCPKCNGLGFIGVYAHIKSGHCFECEGTRQIRETRRAAQKRQEQQTLLELGYDPFSGETVDEFMRRVAM